MAAVKKHRKLGIEDLRAKAAERGGECLSDVYLNCFTKYLWKCCCGYQWEASSHYVLNGTWCPKCAGRKDDIDTLREVAALRGGLCLSLEYRKSAAKYLWKCANSHQWEATARDVKSGEWCPDCSGNKKLGLVVLQQHAEKKGGRCLTKEYINNQTPCLWTCTKNHSWMASANNVLYQDTWCPRCVKQQSFPEIELRLLVKSIYPDTPDKPVRGLLQNRRFELDIWVPNLRKAIEFDGEYHHGLPGASERDARKDAECIQASIGLLRVKYLDYVKNTEAVQQKVLDFLRSP